MTYDEQHASAYRNDRWLIILNERIAVSMYLFCRHWVQGTTIVHVLQCVQARALRIIVRVLQCVTVRSRHYDSTYVTVLLLLLHQSWLMSACRFLTSEYVHSKHSEILISFLMYVKWTEEPSHHGNRMGWCVSHYHTYTSDNDTGPCGVH